jgi:hypothetical protein
MPVKKFLKIGDFLTGGAFLRPSVFVLQYVSQSENCRQQYRKVLFGVLHSKFHILKVPCISFLLVIWQYFYPNTLLPVRLDNQIYKKNLKALFLWSNKLKFCKKICLKVQKSCTNWRSFRCNQD